MLEVIKNINNVEEALRIVHDIKNMGYVQGTDFDFKYVAPIFDLFHMEIKPKQITLIFYKEELATWFNLRY